MPSAPTTLLGLLGILGTSVAGALLLGALAAVTIKAALETCEWLNCS